MRLNFFQRPKKSVTVFGSAITMTVSRAGGKCNIETMVDPKRLLGLNAEIKLGKRGFLRRRTVAEDFCKKRVGIPQVQETYSQLNGLANRLGLYTRRSSNFMEFGLDPDSAMHRTLGQDAVNTKKPKPNNKVVKPKKKKKNKPGV